MPPMMFQSSLELSPECNPRAYLYSLGRGACFNPHSSFRPSATWDFGLFSVPLFVRFNPHSSFRPSATIGYARKWPRTASFNPHSSFRPSATQCNSPSCAGRSIWFQSSLELSPECNKTELGLMGSLNSFNPHSSFRPSATQPRSDCLPDYDQVSILTRAFARVQRLAPRGKGRKEVFQSSLELSPECNAVPVSQVRPPTRGFNPHSSFRPSATAPFFPHPHLPPVSILTRAFARVQQEAFSAASDAADVSILTRAFARVQPAPESTGRNH